jgi:polysaccharide biosynthesis protein PelA
MNLLKSCCFFLLVCTQLSALSRSVLALYDSQIESDIHYTVIHRYAEMPLNYLGVDVIYHDISKGYPNIKEYDFVLGVLSWLPTHYYFEDPDSYLKFAISALDNGKLFVLMGKAPTEATDERLLSEFFDKLGLTLREKKEIKYDSASEIRVKDPVYFFFERKYFDIYNSYPDISSIIPPGKILLSLEHPKNEKKNVVIAAITERGGYVAKGFSVFEVTAKDPAFTGWYIQPFNFFKEAFRLQNLPKPDTTTLAGRRIYYSHIDGDGWLSISEVEKYQKNKKVAAEVILEEILKSFPNLPVTVSPIAAELDTHWVGTNTSQRIAREIFKLKNIEAGSHTYSHPFDWDFFKNYKKEQEIPYLKHFNGPVFEKETLIEKYFMRKKDQKFEYSIGRYDIPRAYATEPFSLKIEVQDAMDEVGKFLPENKKIKIYQWSGRTTPWEGAIRAVRLAKVFNINGGDNRFDREFNSYANVSSIGRRVGQELQIYSSNSNENTYTNLWKGRYFGYNLLPETIYNTGTPYRILPINIYYHMFSGEKNESLAALIKNIGYAEEQNIIPIETSLFTAIANGFYRAEIEQNHQNGYIIKNRGALQTIRFDSASDKAIDFSKSQGVIGQKYLQGSLYVYLDALIENPSIYLEQINPLKGYPKKSIPYLEDSRWQIFGLHRSRNKVFLTAKGYGRAQMTWRGFNKGRYIITYTDGEILDRKKIRVSDDQILELDLPLEGLNSLIFQIKEDYNE